MHLRRTSAAIAAVLAMTACDGTDSSTDTTSTAVDQTATGASGLELIHAQTDASYEIRELNLDRRPYALVDPVPLVVEPVDEDGITLHERDEGRFYHPVQLARRGINLSESYRVTGDERYLESALAHGRKLASIAEIHSGAAFYPYTFDFLVQAPEVTLRAPWYSAMAQGQALTLFHRLQEYTGSDEFETIIDQTYRSFELPRGTEGEPWVITRDVDGRIWLDEYPTPNENYHVLNGHIFATYGLYEHFVVTGEGRELLEEVIQTVDDAIAEFRIRDAPSRYAIPFDARDPVYHFIHIRQLRTLSEITGERVFRHWMGVLVCDSPPTQAYADNWCDGRTED